jgi:hypothetical protein
MAEVVVQTINERKKRKEEFESAIASASLFKDSVQSLGYLLPSVEELIHEELDETAEAVESFVGVKPTKSVESIEIGEMSNEAIDLIVDYIPSDCKDYFQRMLKTYRDTDLEEFQRLSIQDPMRFILLGDYFSLVDTTESWAEALFSSKKNRIFFNGKIFDLIGYKMLEIEMNDKDIKETVKTVSSKQRIKFKETLSEEMSHSTNPQLIDRIGLYEMGFITCSQQVLQWLTNHPEVLKNAMEPTKLTGFGRLYAGSHSLQWDITNTFQSSVRKMYNQDFINYHPAEPRIAVKIIKEMPASIRESHEKSIKLFEEKIVAQSINEGSAQFVKESILKRESKHEEYTHYSPSNQTRSEHFFENYLWSQYNMSKKVGLDFTKSVHRVLGKETFKRIHNNLPTITELFEPQSYLARVM